MHVHISGSDRIVRRTWDVLEEIMLRVYHMPYVHVTVNREKYLESLSLKGHSGHPELPVKRQLHFEEQDIPDELVFSPVAMKALDWADGDITGVPIRNIREAVV